MLGDCGSIVRYEKDWHLIGPSVGVGSGWMLGGAWGGNHQAPLQRNDCEFSAGGEGVGKMETESLLIWSVATGNEKKRRER